jgi:hypothetical protein
VLTFAVKSDRDDQQAWGRSTINSVVKHSVFGRTDEPFHGAAGLCRRLRQHLKTNVAGANDIIHSTTFVKRRSQRVTGQCGPRVGEQGRKVDNYQTPFFSPRDIGANIYSYLPVYMSVSVTPGFQIYSGTNTKALFFKRHVPDC